MAIWDNTTKTEAGLALEQKLLVQALPLKIKSAIAGAGKVNPTQLSKQTKILDPRQELSLQRSFLTSDGTAIIPVSYTHLPREPRTIRTKSLTLWISPM